MSQFAHGIRSFDASSLDAAQTNLSPSSSSSPIPTYVLGVKHVSSTTLMAHLQSIIWLTYRKDFAQMTPYEFTSDAGWGCMLRTAQMLLCEALIRNLSIHCDRRFQWSETEPLAPEVVQVLRWFVDSPLQEDGCLYAIHHMVSVGMKYDKLPGEWYGPTTAAQVLRDLVNDNHLCADQSVNHHNMCMYVPQDGVIYTEDITKLCITCSWVDDTKKPTSPTTTDASTNSSAAATAATDECVSSTAPTTVLFDPLWNPPTVDTTSAPWTKSVLILIPLRLGLDTLNAMYIPGECVVCMSRMGLSYLDLVLSFSGV
jgi:cysteine protease ATG4